MAENAAQAIPVAIRVMPRSIFESENTSPIQRQPKAMHHAASPEPVKIKAEARAPAVSGNAGSCVLSLGILYGFEHYHERRNAYHNPQSHGLKERLYSHLLYRGQRERRAYAEEGHHHASACYPYHDVYKYLR